MPGEMCNTVFVVCVVAVILTVVGVVIHRINHRVTMRKRQKIPQGLRILYLKMMLGHVYQYRGSTKPWLVYGTLLGFEREGGIIPWDFDVDLGVRESEFEELKQGMRQLCENNPEYTMFTVNIGSLCKFIHIVERETGLNVDISAYHIDEERGVSRCVPSLYSKHILHESSVWLPKSAFFPLRHKDFETSRVYVPRDPPRLLRDWYGDDWQIPKVY